MTYHSVIEFINAGRACGLDKHEIAERLKHGGWLDIDIKDAFKLADKMEIVKNSHTLETCPSDNSEDVPSPKIGNKLLERRTPHMSAMRFTMWIVILIVVFYGGFVFMQ